MAERNNDMELLYTVRINPNRFPKLSECTKETMMPLITIENTSSMIELVIESNEPDNVLESEYQEPTYVVYVTIDGETVDRLVHPYDFENMIKKEMIDVLTELFTEMCI